jgi:uncharacterized membrane protein
MSGYDLLLITHFIGLALALGTGFANMRLGMASADMPPEERTKFFLRAFAIGKNGSIGLLLLILSGLGMLFARGFRAMFALGGGTFHAKLTLVVILMGLLGWLQVLTKRAREAQGGPTMAQIPKVGRAMLVTGIAIVILAVLSFH